MGRRREPKLGDFDFLTRLVGAHLRGNGFFVFSPERKEKELLKIVSELSLIEEFKDSFSILWDGRKFVAARFNKVNKFL